MLTVQSKATDSLGYSLWALRADNFKMTFISVQTACNLMVSASVSETPAASIFRTVTFHFYFPEDWGSSLTDRMPCIVLILEAI